MIALRETHLKFVLLNSNLPCCYISFRTFSELRLMEAGSASFLAHHVRCINAFQNCKTWMAGIQIFYFLGWAPSWTAFLYCAALQGLLRPLLICRLVCNIPLWQNKLFNPPEKGNCSRKGLKTSTTTWQELWTRRTMGRWVRCLPFRGLHNQFLFSRVTDVNDVSSISCDRIRAIQLKWETFFGSLRIRRIWSWNLLLG